MNFSIKINLLRIAGAAILNIKGKTATKKCLVIPLDDNNQIYDGAKGIYVDLVAWEKKEAQFDNTHFVKISLSKEDFEKMSKEEQDAIPIIGSMRPLKSSKTEVSATVAVDEDDMPF